MEKIVKRSKKLIWGYIVFKLTKRAEKENI